MTSVTSARVFAASALFLLAACGGGSNASGPPPAAGGAGGGGGAPGGLDQCTYKSGGKTPDDAQQLLSWPTKTIADLDRAKVASGGYNVEGYVWDIYVPQGCPAGEMCADEPPHVIVNEKSSDEWLTNPRQLAVIVRDPSKLKSGVRYKMSLAVCGTKEMGASINVAEMRAYVELVK
jgi:hypothetical protein